MTIREEKEKAKEGKKNATRRRWREVRFAASKQGSKAKSCHGGSNCKWRTGSAVGRAVIGRGLNTTRPRGAADRAVAGAAGTNGMCCSR